jgi:hypothetical protein
MLTIRQPTDAKTGTPKTTATATAAVSVGDMLRTEGYTIDVFGITTGTIQLQSSIDGSNWTNEGAALTANGRVTLSANNLVYIRGNVTVATAVAIVLTVVGRQAQEYASTSR